MLITVYIYHHGGFRQNPNIHYVGGSVDVVKSVDTDLFSFRDLEDYANEYKYRRDAKVYYKNDGNTWDKGIRLVWDDNSIMTMIKVSEPHGKMELYVDSLGIDESTLENQIQTLSNESDLQDSDFVHDSTTASSESFSGLEDESDDELAECRSKLKSVAEEMLKGGFGLSHTKENESDESNFGSDQLRSDSSSSEDENARIGYIGPPPPKRKKKKSVVYNPDESRENVITFESGMKFVSMNEFRKVVREYGVKERRAVKFGHSDTKRCQVYCEPGCPFYIWATRLEDCTTVQIRTISCEHLCTKPFENKLANVDYLTKIYGDSRHLYSNFRKKFPSQLLKRAFWNASCATYPMAHERSMKQLEKLSKSAHDQLRRLDTKKWTKAHFSCTSHSDSVENNMSECFNAWIINERYMPILTMFQELHFKLMNRIIQKKMLMADSNLVICPRIKKKLDKAVTQSREWQVCWDGNRKFQVKSGTKALTVDLVNNTCDCRVFDLTGIPCAHAVACIHDRRQHPIDYVSDWYKKDKYTETYKHSLEPIRGSEFWDVTSLEKLFPPDIPKKLRGRPKKMRRREEWEGGRSSQSQSQLYKKVRHNAGRVMHCSICKKPGHKKQTCPDKPDDETTVDGDNVEIHKNTNDDGSVGGETTKVKLPVKRKKKGISGATDDVIPAQSSQIKASRKKKTLTSKEKKKEKTNEKESFLASGDLNGYEAGGEQDTILENLISDLANENLF